MRMKKYIKNSFIACVRACYYKTIPHCVDHCGRREPENMAISIYRYEYTGIMYDVT